MSTYTLLMEAGRGEGVCVSVEGGGSSNVAEYIYCKLLYMKGKKTPEWPKRQYIHYCVALHVPSPGLRPRTQYAILAQLRTTHEQRTSSSP